MAWVVIGWGLISMKVWWSVPASVTAWVNRTGLRTLAAQYSASKTGVALRLSYTVVKRGIVAIFGSKPTKDARTSGRIGSMIGLWEATSMLTRPAKRSRRCTSLIRPSICAGGPAIMV